MSDSSIALKPVIDEPSKPMPSSSAPSTSLVVIEKLFRCPSRSVNQSSTSSIAALLDLLEHALACLRVGRRPVLALDLRHDFLLVARREELAGLATLESWSPRSRAPRRPRLAPAARGRRHLARAARCGRLVLAPPERPPLGRRLGGARQRVGRVADATRDDSPGVTPPAFMVLVTGRTAPRAHLQRARRLAEREPDVRAGRPRSSMAARAAFLPLGYTGASVELDRRGDSGCGTRSWTTPLRRPG